MSSLTSFNSSGIWPVTRLLHCLNSGISLERCKPASLPQTTRQQSMRHCGLNSCFTLRRHSSRQQTFASMARFRTPHTGIPHLPTRDSSISRLWPLTTGSSKYGRSIARRISKTAPRWSARRSHESRVVFSMPSSSTKRQSAQPTKTALSTMRRRQRSRCAVLHGTWLR